MRLFELTAEQSFLHQRVIRDAEKLDKAALVKVLTDVHRLYLIKGGLFTRLVNWCARSGVTLPAFDELYEGSDGGLKTDPESV
jgi:hypothetical protein